MTDRISEFMKETGMGFPEAVASLAGEALSGMKKYDVIDSDGTLWGVSAERMTIEGGAATFYGRRSSESREEIVATWGAGAWRRVIALNDAGRPVTRVGECG